MQKRITRADSQARLEHVLHRSNDGDTIVAQTRQDIEPILEENQALRNSRSGFKGDMHHVASIPLVVYEKLWKEGIAQDEDRLRDWLNNSDNKMFRTHPGQL